jgi:hypothetical protein
MKRIALTGAWMVVTACSVRPATGELAQAATGSGIADAGLSDGGGGGHAVFHAVSNSHEANSGYYDPNTGGSGGVTVFENGTGAARTAYLLFFFSGPDLSSQVCTTTNDPWWGTITTCSYTRYVFENGAGAIPSGDFSVNPSSARLHTTTPATFQGERCTEDLTAGTFTCESNGGQLFDVAWAVNGNYSTFSNGVSEQTWGNRTVRTQGSYRSASATLTGTAAGRSMTGDVGYISDSKGSSVTHDVF